VLELACSVVEHPAESVVSSCGAHSIFACRLVTSRAESNPLNGAGGGATGGTNSVVGKTNPQHCCRPGAHCGIWCSAHACLLAGWTLGRQAQFRTATHNTVVLAWRTLWHVFWIGLCACELACRPEEVCRGAMRVRWHMCQVACVLELACSVVERPAESGVSSCGAHSILACRLGESNGTAVELSGPCLKNLRGACMQG
jgi:hypothetical protein